MCLNVLPYAEAWYWYGGTDGCTGMNASAQTHHSKDGTVSFVCRPHTLLIRLCRSHTLFDNMLPLGMHIGVVGAAVPSLVECGVSGLWFGAGAQYAI